jgi:hypothetical protein
MRALASAAILLLGSACSREQDARTLKPPAELVDRIERQLPRFPCIGPLSRWERHYGYGSGGDDGQPNGGVERDRIVFTFVQAGIYGYRAKRLIDASMEGPGIDERQMRVAFGEYDVRSRRLVLIRCGWNQTPPAAAPAR